MQDHPTRPGLGPTAALALGLIAVREAASSFFLAMIVPEGTRAISPTTLFAGAPRSHYAAEHTVALRTAEYIESLPGRMVSVTGILVLAALWMFAVGAARTRSARLVIHAVLLEAVVLAANQLFSAGAAQHHVGWGMPCRADPLTSLVLVHLAVAVAVVVPVLLVVSGSRAPAA